MALVDEHTRALALIDSLDANAELVEGSLGSHRVGNVSIDDGANSESRYAVDSTVLRRNWPGVVAVETTLRLGLWRRTHDVRAKITGGNDVGFPLEVSDVFATRGSKSRKVEGLKSRDLATRALGEATGKLADAAYRFSAANF